ncbi:hypothetical protein PMPD1_0731 [Paramixta manurensis]|uniref:Tsi6 domain-containing protein n=1 Tax=Paramixta manurensis TaxID=2740817 RepID=A0A6M8UJR6_9GAMM|nr:hypothetical protein PMPD1_0731 [Erwiniaceae bacterium PD-1]
MIVREVIAEGNYTAIDYVNDAIDVLQSRLVKKPTFALYIMAFEQVKCVKNILLEVEKDKSKLHTMNLGVLASKEFDTTDPELAQSLSNVNYIASQVGQGLKVILPHQIDPEYKKRKKRCSK